MFSTLVHTHVCSTGFSRNGPAEFRLKPVQQTKLSHGNLSVRVNKHQLPVLKLSKKRLILNPITRVGRYESVFGHQRRSMNVPKNHSVQLLRLCVLNNLVFDSTRVGQKRLENSSQRQHANFWQPPQHVIKHAGADR